MKSATDEASQKIDENKKIRRYALISVILWTLLLTGLFVAYVVDNRAAIQEIGYNMAKASLEKDILFRRWAAGHGGVYVPETSTTPPSPYLKHIPERDILTPSGRRLTLLNPAYMTRQVYEMEREQAHIPRGHLTSLNPLRPENTPDAWESKALSALKQGSREIVESVRIQGLPHLRIMQPFMAEKSCLKCHSGTGYNPGESSGGISITLSLAPIATAMNSEMKNEALIHSMIWLLGIGFIYVGSNKISATMTSLRNERNRLSESEERYRALFTRAGDGILILATDGKIIEVNESIALMYGYSVQEMQQMNLKQLDTPESSKFMRERIFRLLAGESLTFEVEHFHKDGHIFPLEVSASLIFSGGDSYLQCFHRDITERKQAELRLADSECRLRTIFENEPECIKILDQQGCLMQMNPAGLRMIEADSLEQVTGAPILDVIAPEFREAYADLHRRVIAGETLQLKYEVLGLKGGRRWLETHAVPMQDHNRILHLAVTRDISDRKKAEEDHQLLEQQLQQAQKLESLGVLAGGIAHDFNNILTVILGHCYLAKEDPDLTQPYGSYFQQIESASNRAADLCRQMLTYAGKSPLVQSRVNLWLLVDDVVKMLQSAIKKNVTIELDLNERIPEIIGDTGQIQQIVMNLIINAAEAIGDAKGTIRVVLKKSEIESDQLRTDTFGTLIRPGKYSCLEVSDTGIGMNMETQKRIFEPFYTTKFAGRGLGMSAIRGIVASHEGVLELTSTEGVGTTFKICFPVPGSFELTESVATTPPPLQPATGTILLVEDEQTLRTMGTALLEILGFTPLTAEHGREALALFHEHASDIDIILLDLIMPVMGGEETYHELRKIAPTIPIVICSGYGIDSVTELIQNDRYAGFVHKPYKPDQLRDVIMQMRVSGSKKDGMT